MLLLLPITLFGVGESKELVVSIAQLPVLSESADKGTLVDLVKAMREEYKEGNIKIEVYPFGRAVNQVLLKKADFVLPIIRNPFMKQSDDPANPYRFSTESLGKVAFLIYSNVENKINKKAIESALAKGGKFPYKFDAPYGLDANFIFPVSVSNDLVQGFKKLNAKRIDGLIWAQEEADTVLKNLKLKTIHREHWLDFDTCALILKGEESNKIDYIITDTIKKLKANGKLEKLFLKIHGPFIQWQPY